MSCAEGRRPVRRVGVGSGAIERARVRTPPSRGCGLDHAVSALEVAWQIPRSTLGHTKPATAQTTIVTGCPSRAASDNYCTGAADDAKKWADCVAPDMRPTPRELVLLLAYQWWLLAAFVSGGRLGDWMTRRFARFVKAPKPGGALNAGMNYPQRSRGARWHGTLGDRGPETQGTLAQLAGRWRPY
jgi:hypothetical protein